MLLVLTSTDDATADHLCGILPTRNVDLVRINTDTFSRSARLRFQPGTCTLSFDGRDLHPDQISHVWYRRPRGIAIEEGRTPEESLHTSREWGSSLDGFLAHIDTNKWMNSPSANVRASNKLFQLSLAKELGLNPPDTLVTQSGNEARIFWEKCDGGVIMKPLSVGYVETVDGQVQSLIYTTRVSRELLSDDSLLAKCPTLFQREVHRGADVRVTIADSQLVAVRWLPREGSTAPVDIRQLEWDSAVYEETTLPDKLEVGLRRLVKALNLRFVAIDLIQSADGSWFFLEVNPNGQWAWIDILGGIDVSTMFVRAFGGHP